jgi:FtsP/CotA-like multicopper oxidase with cupredoxin domain
VGGPGPGGPPPPARDRRQAPPPGGGGIPHPIHLHGHDFYVLGAGSGNFSNVTELQFTNPPRRDVAMLPGGGWLVIGFITDNPGAWLMHCHIVSLSTLYLMGVYCFRRVERSEH